MIKDKLHEITFVKGIAIIWIVVFHIYKDFPDIFLKHGNGEGISFSHFIMLSPLGVNLFVICTGFLLSYSSGNIKKISLPFFMKRLGKLLPLYYFAIVSVLALDWLFGRSNFHYDLLSIIVHLLCLHSLTSYIFDIQGAWWFMGLIFQLYLVFPLCNRYIVLYKFRTIFVVLTLAIISRFINVANVNSNYSLFAFIPDLIFGMFIYRYLWVRGQYRFNCFILLLCFMAVCLIVYIMHNNLSVCSYGYGLPRSFISIGLFYIISYLYKILSRYNLNIHKIILSFGLYSYAIYLLHRPFIYKYIMVSSLYMNRFWLVAIYLSIMLFLGMSLTNFEKLLRRKIKKYGHT